MFSAPKAKRQVHELKTPQRCWQRDSILATSYPKNRFLERQGDWRHARGTRPSISA